MISTLFAIGKKTSGKTKLKQKVIKTDVEPELQTFDTYKDVGLDEEGLISLQNKLKNSVKQKEEDFGLPHRAKQDPKVIEAALSLSKNDIGVEDFRNLIFKKNQPKNWDFVPRPAGVQEIAAAVTGTAKGVSGPGDKVPKITRGIINVNKTIEEGAFVSSRLDIPAYNKYDVWAVTIHKARNAKKDKGSVLGFGQTAMLTDVTFVAPAQGGFMIATSQIPKNPIARMEGRWKNHTTEEAYEKAQELLTDKNWTQVGYNPFRVSYFYDRATMNPVVAADEVIQVGPFVIAKNVKTAKPTDKRFEVKTKEGNRFNFEEGGKVSTNEQMDRLGFDNGGAVLNYIAQARGYEDPAFLKQYADEVKWQETRGAGPTTVQNNNGPARGSYQVEGSQGSSRNETILQRAQNFYEKYPDAPKSKEITYALEQRGKDLDFSSLSEDTQDALFYMDAERGTLPLNELASGKLNHKTAWMNYWNQGPDQEVMEQKWDRAQEEKIIFLKSQDK